MRSTLLFAEVLLQIVADFTCVGVGLLKLNNLDTNTVYADYCIEFCIAALVEL